MKTEGLGNNLQDISQPIWTFSILVYVLSKQAQFWTFLILNQEFPCFLLVGILLESCHAKKGFVCLFCLPESSL